MPNSRSSLNVSQSIHNDFFQIFQTLYPLTNNVRSKCVSIHTLSYQTLYPLPNNVRSKCVYLSTHKAINL